MLSIEQLTEELYDSYKVAMGSTGNGAVIPFSELTESAKKVLIEQAKYLSDKYYFFRQDTGDKILSIMSEEIEHWKQRGK